jgi:4-diphosphocytidyl-2-C-methyl-D-erythritol kinase
MTVLERERAYAKINLCLFLGPARSDGRHELVTVFDSVGLADDLVVRESRGAADVVLCDGVPGPNLVADALTALRATGWAAPPLTVTIDKRIPVAAGMGGGSADAAAMLRCAPRLAPVSAAVLAEIAAGLGADVPGQLRPGPSLGTGAGELIEPLPPLSPYGVLVIPRRFALSTPAVYREADRLGLPRSGEELAALLRPLTAAIPPGPTPELIVNDLQPAALSLAPQIGQALDAARDAGADHALVCGSGPTVIGIFDGADGERRAVAAATALSDLFDGVFGTRPVDSSQFVVLA